MWQRKSFHDCASELMQVSHRFRRAHIEKIRNETIGIDTANQTAILEESSIRGVEILRTLALAIRSDQDYGLTTRGMSNCGSLVTIDDSVNLVTVIGQYRPPHTSLDGSRPIGIRDALNKIAHADPRQSSYFADDSTHDLLLVGTDRSRQWLAVVSLIDLSNAVQALPDVNLR